MSLDGGGIRGAFAAAYLADVERRTGVRICEYFDLIAGTSTGAIIAAALAFEMPAADIENFYRARGPDIFVRRKPPNRHWLSPLRWARWPSKLCVNLAVLRWLGLDIDGLLRSKYGSTSLMAALESVFAQQTLGAAKKRLVIPSIDIARGQTVVFKTRHYPGLVNDHEHRMVDVLMATTAAPTYFPHAVIRPGSTYVDGGLWANNPTMVAIVEAARIRRGLGQPCDMNDVFVLSVGTGSPSFFAAPPIDGAGLGWWASGARGVELGFLAQSQGTHFQAMHLLGERYLRIDFDVPGKDWQLDRIDLIDTLSHLGQQRSAETVANVRALFLDERADPFVPSV